MEISFSAETITHLGPLAITNSLLMAWAAMGLLIAAGLAATYRVSAVPSAIQNVAESGIELALDFFADVLGSRHEAERVFPLVFTFFIFILISNWLGLVPGIGSIGFIETHGEHAGLFVPLLRSTYSDLNMTLALALISVVSVHVIAVSRLGLFKHIGKFITFKNPIAFFVGILELIAEVAKILSFSFRLFGNVFAGEVLLVVILGLVPYIVPLPFFALEIFVGFIQALVFSMLTLVFIKVAITETEH